MSQTRTTTLLLLILAMVAVWGRAAGAGPALPNAAQVRAQVEGSICRVVTRNGLGVPIAYATGFLIGDGSFVVTDLASVYTSGFAGVDVEFEGGGRASVSGFGMADRLTGLVALRIEGDPGTPGRSGLAVAASLPPLEGRPFVVALGWAWGERLETAVGRLEWGESASALAQTTGVRVPPSEATFLSAGGRLVPGTTGVPLIDASGQVAGVALDVRGQERSPVVVSGAMLRRALLAAEPNVRPLAELPKALWPIRRRRVCGEPVHPATVARAIPALKTRLRCTRCNGAGTVKVKRVIGRKTVLGDAPQPVYGLVPTTCPLCKGESVLIRDGFHDAFGTTVEQATRLRYQPEADKDARKAARDNVLEILEGLAKVGATARVTFSRQGAEALDRAATTDQVPQGVAVYAQVRQSVAGPDGGYTLLAPYGSARMLAARTHKAGEPSERTELGRFDDWTYGRWLAVAGVVDRSCELDGKAVLHFRPLVWVAGPNLGPAPARPRPARPDPQPKPAGPGGSRDDGVPDFFGL